MSKVYTAVLLIITFLSLILGCTAPTTSTNTTVTPTAGPKYGGTLHLMLGAAPVSMDPVKQVGLHSSAVAKLYGDTLVKWKGANNSELSIAPSLAKSWEISPDGLVITFHLREGVKFHNVAPVNGREMTSDDVKFSIDRILKPAPVSFWKAALGKLNHVEAPDKYTVKLVYDAPTPDALAFLSSGYATIFAREVIEKDGDASKTIVGTGPFIFLPAEYVDGSQINLKKNPDYWDTGKPYVDRVEVTVMPDESTQLAAFRAGRLDMISATKVNADALQKTMPDAKRLFPVDISNVGLQASMKQNPTLWGDARVRKALLYAIDCDSLIKACADGAASRTGWIAPYFAEWGAPQLADLPKRDIAKSKALLAEAGYPNGFKTTIMQHTARMDAWGGAVEPVAAMLKDVGIDAEIKQMEHGAFNAAVSSGQFELACSGMAFFAAPLDPHQTLSYTYLTNGVTNRNGYSNPKVDALILAQQNDFTDKAKRKDDIKQLLTLLDQDTPVIPLYYQWKFIITQPGLKGWDNAGDGNNTFGFHNAATAWFDKK
jgi:peptide/nickel transport system substrate-binding protein